MGVIITKIIEIIVKCNEKLYLHYFEEPLLIVFDELIFHLLELCFFTREIGIPWWEIGIPWIWNHFIVLEKSFYIFKNACWLIIFNTLEKLNVFFYSNLYQMFSYLL